MQNNGGVKGNMETETAEAAAKPKQKRTYRRRQKVAEVTPDLVIKKGNIQTNGGQQFFLSCMYTVTIDGWNIVNFGVVDIPDGYALYLDAELAGTEHEVLIVPKMFVGKDAVLSLMAINLSARNFRTLYAGEQLVRGILVKTNGGSETK